MAGMSHTADVYGVATVQEEVGLRAVTSAYGIVPDLGIAIDVGFGDSPGLPESDTIAGQRPRHCHRPHVHPKVHERMIETAKEWNIGYSLDPSPTQAGQIHMRSGGSGRGGNYPAPIPLRYMHTPIETISYDDVKQTGRLMALFIAGLDHEFVEGLTCF